MGQLIIWLVLTAIILVARFLNVVDHRELFTGQTYTVYIWKGDWLKGVPLLWFVLSGIIYFAK
jgi:hypothetical protein